MSWPTFPFDNSVKYIPRTISIVMSSKRSIELGVLGFRQMKRNSTTIHMIAARKYILATIYNMVSSPVS